MTVASWISKLRIELRDFGVIQRDLFDGDASTKNFILNHVPVLENSYTISIGGAAKVEDTDYTFDKDTGVISFTSAPASGSDNIEAVYKSVKVKDADYIQFMQDAINHLSGISKVSPVAVGFTRDLI